MSFFREHEPLVQGLVGLRYYLEVENPVLIERVLKMGWQEDIFKRTTGHFGFLCRTCPPLLI